MKTPLARLAPLAVLGRWAVRAHEQSCRNARTAATESSRRQVERAEIEHYLEGHVEPVRVAAHG